MDKRGEQLSPATLKTGWRMVKFGDVVNNANLVERDPVKNGIERIVGLEHLDPENLHIRHWNSPEDGTSFTRKFVPGQTLFGKRRAYQKKVAYAEFEGICSGDILTFESKDTKLLLPELLPFICQTDAFFDYALGTSAGSLSPRTSWKALRNFEFPLPPIEEQKRFAEILWAADEAVERLGETLGRLEHLRQRYFNDVCMLGLSQQELINLHNTSQGWPVQKLANVIKIRSQKSPVPHQLPEYLGLEHFEPGSFILCSRGQSLSVKSTCNMFTAGDLLYGKLRPNLDKAMIADSKGVCSTEILVIEENRIIPNELLVHYFHCPKFILWNTSRAFGTKMPRTSVEIVGDYRIPVPPNNIQIEIISHLNSI
ncbi:MAG: restriction endonuclease subunit S, partial [Acidobacteriota bacterium]